MILAGLARLGDDAALRYTPGGQQVCNLSLAFNYGKKGDDDKKPTQWVDASLWGERAEKLAGYLKKGTTLDVVLEDPHIETYESRNGTGSKLVARVVLLEFAGGGQRDQAGGGEKPAQQSKKPAAQAPAGGADFDDDLPPF